jgi:hypothetical protein
MRQWEPNVGIEPRGCLIVTKIKAYDRQLGRAWKSFKICYYLNDVFKSHAAMRQRVFQFATYLLAMIFDPFYLHQSQRSRTQQIGFYSLQ